MATSVQIKIFLYNKCVQNCSKYYWNTRLSQISAIKHGSVTLRRKNANCSLFLYNKFDKWFMTNTDEEKQLMQSFTR